MFITRKCHVCQRLVEKAYDVCLVLSMAWAWAAYIETGMAIRLRWSFIAVGCSKLREQRSCEASGMQIGCLDASTCTLQEVLSYPKATNRKASRWEAHPSFKCLVIHTRSPCFFNPWMKSHLGLNNSEIQYPGRRVPLAKSCQKMPRPSGRPTRQWLGVAIID